MSTWIWSALAFVAGITIPIGFFAWVLWDWFVNNRR